MTLILFRHKIIYIMDKKKENNRETKTKGGAIMKEIKLINSKKGWLARYINDDRVMSLFGTDTISTAFTEKASPMMVKSEIERLNPEYNVSFNV